MRPRHVLLLVALAGCPARPASAPAPVAPVAVSVARAEARAIPRTLRATGSVFPIEATTVAAEVAGRIVEVSRELGDRVREGEVLLRIDPTDHELARDERERAHRQVLARLGLEAPPKPDIEVDALPAVQRAKLQAQNARAKYERNRELAERHEPLVSAEELADLRTAAEVAESGLRAERNAARALLAEERTLEAQIAIARRRVELAQARAPKAARDVVYEVADRHVFVGDYVTSGTPLFRLVAASPAHVRLNVPERGLGVVKVDLRATVRVASVAAPIEARVARLGPSVDLETRTFRADLVFPNADGKVKPGSFATAEVEVGTESAVVVPEAALVSFAGVVRVVAARDGKAHDRRVTPGDRRDGWVEVQGLAAGEVVVLSPPATLRHGDPVTVER